MKKFKIFKILLPLIVIGIAAAAAVWLQGAGWIGNRAESPEDALQAALRGSPGPADQDPAEDEPALHAEDPDETEKSGPPEEMQEPDGAAESADMAEPALSTEDLPLCDLYAAPGQTVRFRVYHPEAVDLVWEYYDMELRKWLPVAKELVGSERDALGRMTAYADLETPGDQTELMIRCMYETEDSGEQISEMAFLRALPQEIKRLALADGSIAAEAGSYMAACDVAVKVTYADDTSDIINGLYGLYFMRSETEEESSEYIFLDGILTERKVQTSLNHFYLYQYVSAGEESIALAYLPDTGSSPLLLSGTVAGTDEEPPVISGVDILIEEDIPGTEGERSVTIQVSAEDNVTPYPRLQYAVTKEAEIGEITEEAWTDSPRITFVLQGNSKWSLNCRDQAGNITVYQYDQYEDPPEDLPEEEKDTQAPVIRNIYVEAN